MSPEDENKEKETLAFTVRYRTADLKRLSILAKSTQIGARHLLRALLPALLEAYESQGSPKARLNCLLMWYLGEKR
jgi:hypothetical protein